MSNDEFPADVDGDVDVDVVVVGAGFAGMYLLHRLRGLGFSARVIEAADDVGGTWYWNRYPGARCDIQSIDYSYSFDPELDEEWTWSQKYAPQPEILRYAQHVADKHDLRRDIQFSTRVDGAVWDASHDRWTVHTSRGEDITCRYYVMATGCLSMPKDVDIVGTDRFRGDVYFTSRWPHEGADLTGKRVAVIGTGSSAIQSIPIMAAQAAQLTVFQRTPNFSIPANNGPIPASKLEQLAQGRAEFREAARWTSGGVIVERPTFSALSVSDEERLAVYEAAWERGGIIEFLGTYIDHLVSPVANELLSEFVRDRIRAIVNDPDVAELLCPKSFPIGAKRLCVDTGYYATFNRPNVRLVDLHAHPISTITEHGVDLADESLEFDVIVFATGFDAMTGAIVSVNITGRAGLTLKDAWAAGPMTYLGLMSAGFPNLFMITGPGSPSVLSNMMVSIEQHVDWIADCLRDLRGAGLQTIEPTVDAVEGWVRHGNDYAAISLAPQANSWYMGANVPGKPRVFMPYAGGVDRYRQACNDVVVADYLGFVRRGPSTEVVNDGIVRRVQPDVALMLEMMASLDLPAMDSMSPADARLFSTMVSAQRAPGPEVGELIDGMLPGAAGDLACRLYRPTTPGPHPLVVYFHGGGWVLGSADSDDPLCRDLCVRADALVISVDYRHAPESRFPAAPDDAFAAVQWVAEHAEELGGAPGQLAVAGWSAGANLAAVVCQIARDAGGPHISGQLLLCPVTDADPTRRSFAENREGYVLTSALMRWFWDHYADEADRSDPKASPLRAASLADLPPTIVVTCELDPLRDEGDAYATALEAAGVRVQHIEARGHIHTSLTAVDVLPSGAPVRAEMAAALRSLFSATVAR
ncbi:MAG: putative flavin-containing monooxygenase [Ilumatobacteraceae bacterium]|nr:putative flavin-containing monooxygenase [Ilumatobacteraceae bacterium]